MNITISPYTYQIFPQRKTTQPSLSFQSNSQLFEQFEKNVRSMQDVFAHQPQEVTQTSTVDEQDSIEKYYGDMNYWAFAGECSRGVKAKEPYKIKTKKEYQTLLKELEQCGLCIFNAVDFREKDYYPHLPEKFVGLIPYCGVYDKSVVLNKYLSGRKYDFPSRYNITALNKTCSILDYSLNELDKEFGKHEGIVYRIGFFEPNVSQYFSTSKEAQIESYINYLKVLQKNFNEDDVDEHNSTLNIIKIKCGHKICDFQEKYLQPKEECAELYSDRLEKTVNIRDAFLKEQEILLPKDKNYQEIPDDVELLEEKYKLAQQLLPHCIENNIKGWQTIDDIINHIKLWEEI